MYLVPKINLFHTLKLGPQSKESANFFNKVWVQDCRFVPQVRKLIHRLSTCSTEYAAPLFLWLWRPSKDTQSSSWQRDRHRVCFCHQPFLSFLTHSLLHAALVPPSPVWIDRMSQYYPPSFRQIGASALLSLLPSSPLLLCGTSWSDYMYLFCISST